MAVSDKQEGIVPTGGSAGLGTGNVLGSNVLDTLGTEVGYGYDGKTTINLGGKEFIFAPVTFRNKAEAAIQLSMIPTALLALALTDPFTPLSEINIEHVTRVMRVLNPSANYSVQSTRAQMGLLPFQVDDMQILAMSRIVWYSIQRFDKEVDLDYVLDNLSLDMMPRIIRLYFRKNLGELDRFLKPFVETLPQAPETTEMDYANPETGAEGSLSIEAQDVLSQLLEREQTPPEMLVKPQEADLE